MINEILDIKCVKKSKQELNQKVLSYSMWTLLSIRVDTVSCSCKCWSKGNKPCFGMRTIGYES
jgi:hypothetical protein